MATETSVATSMSLKQILDGLLVSHREDIHAYGAGHLNESNLLKIKEPDKWESWVSAKTREPTKKEHNKVRRSKPSKVEKEMTDTLASFCLGTLGGPGQSRGKSMAGNKDALADTTDIALIEELTLPEMMLENVKYPAQKSQRDTEPKSSSMFGWTKDDALFPSRHNFVPGYQGAITKKDAYDSLLEFQRDVLRTQDTTERKVLTGMRAVQQLEEKLRTDLEEMPFETTGPNFHRLQIYSECFDDLIQNSSTFGYMLGTIKDEYDDYVAVLLDSTPGHHRALHEQVEQLSTRSCNSELLACEIERVKGKEAEARLLIETNESLRAKLAEEEEQQSSQPESETPTPHTHVVRSGNSSMDLVDHVEDLRAAIWQRLDEISALKSVLHSDHVPATVCNHLEQCIKETEVELQKLQSQKEYFVRSVDEMESDLRGCIEEADTTEKDEKRVWKKIAHVRGSGSSEDDDDELNDDHKWSWYIS